MLLVVLEAVNSRGVLALGYRGTVSVLSDNTKSEYR